MKPNALQIAIGINATRPPLSASIGLSNGLTSRNPTLVLQNTSGLDSRAPEPIPFLEVFDTHAQRIGDLLKGLTPGDFILFKSDSAFSRPRLGLFLAHLFLGRATTLAVLFGFFGYGRRDR